MEMESYNNRTGGRTIIFNNGQLSKQELWADVHKVCGTFIKPNTPAHRRYLPTVLKRIAHVILRLI